MSKKILLSHTKRPANSEELIVALDAANGETENYSFMNVLVDKKTNDISVSTDIGDKFIISNRSNNILIKKANGNKFSVNKKTNKRIKQKK